MTIASGKRVCVVGGGGALAQYVIEHYLGLGCLVFAVCRNSLPKISHPNLAVASPNGTVDLLITMQGMTDDSALMTMEDAQWDRVLDSCLSSVVRSIREYPVSSGGNIVVVGSIIGSVGGRGCANYAAAKAGLVGLVRTAANELAAVDVRVNLLELGYVDCGMGARLDPRLAERIRGSIPLRRFARPDEVVEAVDYLGRVSYMTGNVLTFAGGLR